MKTFKKLYSKLISLENLETAYWKARKNKSGNLQVQEYEKHWRLNNILLHKELMTKTYKPKSLKTFILRDPKTRKINVSDFRDRVVHHALINILQPIYEPRFIYDSYASRVGKGTLKAIQRFDYFLKKVTRNGKIVPQARTKNHVKCFVLKADIKQYFENVNHNILLKIIYRKVKDKEVLWLINILLEQYKSSNLGTGMPLGNWTSQFFANVYLNELDQFVKQKLKAEYYIRYVDDFVIVHRQKRTLEEYFNKIQFFLSTLKLELHPTKCRIFPLSMGVDILGFKTFYKYKRVRRKNVRKIHQKMKVLSNKNTNEKSIFDTIQGWNAYAIHGNTFSLRKRLLSKFIAFQDHSPTFPYLSHNPNFFFLLSFMNDSLLLTFIGFQ